MECETCGDKGRAEVIKSWFDYCGCRTGKEAKYVALLREERVIKKQLDTIRSGIEDLKSELQI